jgi:4-cresol dehydrogenase (hydroxylating)
MNDTKLRTAVDQWRRVLGSSRVIVDKRKLRDVASATYALSNSAVAIVRPRNVEEVQQCVRIATRNRIAIYPISGGKNFGYGSAVPTRDASAIFDLSSMNRMEVHRELAAVSLEPGVTTQGLADYLAAHAPELLASIPINTSPKASPLGNALDRGVGIGPYADRPAHIYSLEVVTGNGEVIRTGMDRFAGDRNLGFTEGRVGPSLTDLFVQSNFGVVTRLTMGLCQTPGDLRRLQVSIKSDDHLAEFIASMRPLVLGDVLTGPLGMYNAHSNAQGALGWRYPWAAAGGRTPLPLAILERLEQIGVPSWVAIIDLWSNDPPIGRAREGAIRKALRGFEISSLRVRNKQSYARPVGSGLPTMYWGKQGPPPRDIDPHRDRCGFVWCDFVLPASPKLLLEIVARIEPLVRAYGFEPAIQLHTVWARNIFLVVNLIYDRDSLGADDRAHRCDEAMTEYLATVGVIPSRRRVGSMSLAPLVEDSERVFARIKSALDPAGIISPGRYELSQKSQSKTSRRKRPSSAYDFVERDHLSLLEKGSATKSKTSADEIRALRPYYIDRKSSVKIGASATATLTALVAGARALAESSAAQTLLGLDSETARLLASQLKNGITVGSLEGVLDIKGEYKVLGFDSSVAQIVDASSPTSAGKSWRSAFDLADVTKRSRSLIQDGIGVVESPSLRSFLKAIGGKPKTITWSDLRTLRRLPALLFSSEWRSLLEKSFGRSALIRLANANVSTNAATDLLLGNLAVFALLSDPSTRPPLPKASAEAVERHLPWTRLLRDERTTHDGKKASLISLVRKHPEDFVLRPLLRSDKSSTFGAYVDETAWKEAISNALQSSEPFVVQERVRTHHEVFPLMRASSLVFEGCYVGIDSIVIGGRVAPAYIVRISETQKVGHRCSGAVPVAAYVDGRA